MTSINTGLEKNQRKEITKKLSELLASNYTLYIKTQNFHWNVKGPFFQQLHLMFEDQYNDLALANDSIAERIRALGFLAPASYKKFTDLSFIEESEEDITAESMVKKLLADHEMMIQKIREIVIFAAERNDEATNDLLNPRLSIHEKTAWMLRSFLGK